MPIFWANRISCVFSHAPFPQSSTDLHRLFSGILLTPQTAGIIFRARLNRKHKDFTVQAKSRESLITIALLD
jgi:hypothetical protein